MKVEIRSSFVKAAKKLPAELRRKLAGTIIQMREVKSIREISNCKKMTGFKTAYRIKLDDYRVGLFL